MNWFEKLEYQLDTGEWISLYKRPLLFEWLMKAFGSEKMCVELFGKLWVPKTIANLKEWAEAHKPLLYHELYHAKHQTQVGEFKWYWGYVVNKNFRLEAEAAAYAEELKHIPEEDREAAMQLFAQWLAGPEYSRAAESPAVAYIAIARYMGD